MNIEQINVDRLIDDIDACAPGFWAHHVLPVGPAHVDQALALGAPDLPAATRAASASAILDRWARKGLSFEAGDRADPVAIELMKSVSDAAAGMAEHPDAPLDAEQILAQHYAEVRDQEGTLVAYVGKQDGVPLLLLNAFGIPLRIWHKLLGQQHYRIIVPVLSSCDPVHGGMQDGASVSTLVTQLQALLTQLDIADVNVLAWCNAGRLGVELLRQCAARIGNLILLSPTLRGGEAAPEHDSPYENSLVKLFKLVRASPKNANAVSTMLGQVPALPDWTTLSDPQARANALFGLPRRVLAADLSKPMASPESLVHYALRTFSDEAVSAGHTGLLPARPITLIQGENDAVVNNAQARHWLGRFAARVDLVTVSGAGHYIQDLQFDYLMRILDRVIQGPQDAQQGASAPAPRRLSARIRFQ